MKLPNLNFLHSFRGLRQLLSLLPFVAFTLTSLAGPVSEKTAGLVASNFMASVTHRDYTPESFHIRCVEVESTPVYYVLNAEGGGYVVVSADDRFVPVIGYSAEGYFEVNHQPAPFRSFMANYEEQILFLIQGNAPASGEMGMRWKQLAETLPAKGDRSVSPLCYSKWNQNYPYNGLCPVDATGPGGHVYAGCVATAMSQIMFYWRWPVQGTGQHSYYWPPYGTISANFGTTTYDWNAMGHSTSIFNEPMALIQYHCGIGVDMMYGPGGSGAYSEDVPGAIKSYFGYHPQAAALARWNYSDEQWMQEVRQQIDQGNPLYYSGCSNSGCHAFVCDGYDNNTPALFHFNFGWGGQSDGYYTLESAGGFSSWQQIVINFKPVDTYTYPTQDFTHITIKTGTIEDGSGPVKTYANSASYKWLIDPQTSEDSVTSIQIRFNRFEMGPGDTLFVYDGADENSPLVGAFTGNTLPADINSAGNKALLHMKTNAALDANGWLLEFKSISPVWCQGSQIFTANEGSFGDGSGNFYYNNFSTCIFQIKPASGEPVTIFFDEFDTEPENDFLRIYDGATQQLLATYSGSYSGDVMPQPVSSENGFLFLVFKTNNTLKGPGWKARYKTGVVGMEDTPQKEVRLSPNPATHTCRVTADPGTEIRVSDLQGRQVIANHRIDESGAFNLNISGLRPGMYLIHLNTSAGQTTLKLIKQ